MARIRLIAVLSDKMYGMDLYMLMFCGSLEILDTCCCFGCAECESVPIGVLVSDSCCVTWLLLFRNRCISRLMSAGG